jgi:hypothetical protein
MYANPGPHSYVLVQTHSHWHTHTHNTCMSQERTNLMHRHTTKVPRIWKDNICIKGILHYYICHEPFENSFIFCYDMDELFRSITFH